MRDRANYWLLALGGTLAAVLIVQLLTGAAMTLYYVAAPDHAYDSVQYISEGVRAGRFVRGLHHYGASFVVVLLALHLLHTAIARRYRSAGRTAWISGMALFGIVLAFALTGYLLPWDQRAYWATVITINLSRLAPGAGDAVAAVLRGGSRIGALTLTRWYALHVVFLPAALIAFFGWHLQSIRRARGEQQATSWYPPQAARTTAIFVAAAVLLAAIAWRGAPPLAPPADPTDATYVPRPEWYFLSLFQLLKYFPGRSEVIGAIVLPTLAIGVLLALPWIDRTGLARPRARAFILAALLAGVAGVTTLTALGWRDRPPAATGRTWSLRAIGGRQFAAQAQCSTCHREGAAADPLDEMGASRPAEWVSGHVVDPEMIAPGLREPPVLHSEREIAAMVAYARQLSRSPYPAVSPRVEQAAGVWARYCVGCHKIDGDGGTEGPDLTHAARKHDYEWLRRWIADPNTIDREAEMPAFQKRLAPADLDAIAAYLAALK